MTNLPKDVIDFLKANGPPPMVGDDELTAMIAAELWGMSKTTAARRLDALVEAGKMTAQPRTGANGVATKVYIPKTGGGRGK